jgi:hypothetical protein
MTLTNNRGFLDFFLSSFALGLALNGLDFFNGETFSELSPSKNFFGLPQCGQLVALVLTLLPHSLQLSVSFE